MLLTKLEAANLQSMNIGELVRSRYSRGVIYDKSQTNQILIWKKPLGEFELMMILEIPTNNCYFHVCTSGGICGYVLCSELLAL